MSRSEVNMKSIGDQIIELSEKPGKTTYGPTGETCCIPAVVQSSEDNMLSVFDAYRKCENLKNGAKYDGEVSNRALLATARQFNTDPKVVMDILSKNGIR